MKVIEAIAKGFSVAGKNIDLLVILFIFNVIWTLLNIQVTGAMPNFNDIAISARVMAMGALFLLINIFIQSGTFGTIKDAISAGGKAPLSNFARYGVKFYLRFLGLGALVIAGIFLGVLLIGVLLGIPVVAKNTVLSVIMVIISAVFSAAGLFFLFLFFFSPYAMVIDDVGIFRAIGNSVRFVRDNMFKVLGLLAMLVLIGLGILFLLWVITGIVGLAFRLQGKAADMIGGVISSAVSSFITLVGSAALMYYYSALRGQVQKKETTVSA